jgi:uncharacterized protein YkwD
MQDVIDIGMKNRILSALALLAVLLPLVVMSGCGRTKTLDTGPEISRAEIMFAHNKERGMKGVEPMAEDATLQDRAQKWAEWMAQNGSLVHSKLTMTGTGFNRMGENIAMGYTDIDSVMQGWMNSSGHKRNIMDPKFNKAGFGYAKTPDGPPYWCAQFGGN